MALQFAFSLLNEAVGKGRPRSGVRSFRNLLLSVPRRQHAEAPKPPFPDSRRTRASTEEGALPLPRTPSLHRSPSFGSRRRERRERRTPLSCSLPLPKRLAPPAPSPQQGRLPPSLPPREGLCRPSHSLPAAPARFAWLALQFQFQIQEKLPLIAPTTVKPAHPSNPYPTQRRSAMHLYHCTP